LNASDFTLAGGTFYHQREVVVLGRIASEPTFVAGDVTVTVAIDANLDLAAATDYLCFLDEDPDDLSLPVKQPPWVGPGQAPPGYHKISPEKWRCYDIASIDTTVATGFDTVTYNLTDAGVTIGATGAPYGGHRGNVTSAAGGNAFAPAAVVRQRHDMATRVDVATATLLPASAGTMDLTDMWVQYDEIADADPADCSGYRFKILATADGAGADDQVFVAGPAIHASGVPCAGNIRLTHGAGRGDLVAVVRFPRIDGNSVGSFKFTGGTLYSSGQWWRLGVTTAAEPTPDIRYNCNWCMYAADANSTHRGYLRDADIGWMSEGTTDTMVVGVFGTHTNDATLRFSNQLLDLGNFEFRRLYIHDTIDNLGAAAGSHGLIATGYNNLTGGEWRIERLTDDSLGFFGHSFGAGFRPRTNVRSVIAHANLWGGAVDKSQDGLNLVGTSAGDGAENGNIAFGQNLVIEDLSIIGTDRQVVVNNILASRVNGLVTGGQRSTASVTNIQDAPAGAVGGTLSDKSAGLYPNRISNSFLTLYGASTGPSGIDITGLLSDSILYYGNRGSSPRIEYLVGLYRSFVDLSGTTSGNTLDHASSDTLDQLNTDHVTVEDSALFTTQTSLFGGYGTGNSSAGRPSSVAIRRSILGTGNINGNLVANIVAGTVQPSTWTLDGLLVTQTATGGTDTITLTGATSVSANDICFFSNAAGTRATALPSPIVLNDTLRLFPTAGSVALRATGDMTLRQMLASAGSVCPEAAPQKMGFAELRRSFVDLGDGVNAHLDLFSSRKLGCPYPNAVGGSGMGRGAPGAGYYGGGPSACSDSY
jgi:hypothetical protein